jgi:hypothetical protein
MAPPGGHLTRADPPHQHWRTSGGADMPPAPKVSFQPAGILPTRQQPAVPARHAGPAPPTCPCSRSCKPPRVTPDGGCRADAWRWRSRHGSAASSRG